MNFQTSRIMSLHTYFHRGMSIAPRLKHRKGTAMKRGTTEKAERERAETETEIGARVSYLFIYNIIVWTIAVFAGVLSLVILFTGGS